MDGILFIGDEEKPIGPQDLSDGLLFSRQTVMNSIFKKLPKPEKSKFTIESLEKRLFLLKP